MKKISAILLAILLVASLAACGGKTVDETPVDSDVVIEGDVASEGENEESIEPEEEKKEENKKEDTKKEETKKEENKKEPAKTEPAAKPEETPAAKPEETPAAKPEETPAAKPEEKPAEPEKAPATLGNTLLADFKAKANAGMSTLAIAEGLMQNEAILFAGGAMEIESGLLSGFGNTEITGFKSGAVFMPMIGSIAFVGYVFELEDAAAVPGFISTLKSNADMRWNICVEAEEMVTGSVGNKVFFVMCPKTLEE